MPEIVVRDRTVPRVLALLPAIVVAVGVRLLTLGTPPVAVRVGAAAVVALACWTAYRLLTAAVTITDAGLRVRGVWYDAEVAWADVHAIRTEPAGLPVRALVWGVLEPCVVTIACRDRILRPVGLLSRHDDEEVERAVGAMLVRSGAWRVPVQRTPVEERVPTR